LLESETHGNVLLYKKLPILNLPTLKLSCTNVAAAVVEAAVVVAVVGAVVVAVAVVVVVDTRQNTRASLTRRESFKTFFFANDDAAK
jgi:hypothetical protein